MTAPDSIRNKLALVENNELKLGSDLIGCVKEHFRKRLDLLMLFIPYWKHYINFASETDTLRILEAFTAFLKCWKVEQLNQVLSHPQLQWVAILTYLLSLIERTLNESIVDLTNMV